MCKKFLLILFAAVSTAHGQLPSTTPDEQPSIVHQFRVHYACQGSTETRDLLVDADTEEEARTIIQNMIPCAVIMKITEILLYQGMSEPTNEDFEKTIKHQRRQIELMEYQVNILKAQLAILREILITALQGKTPPPSDRLNALREAHILKEYRYDWPPDPEDKEEANEKSTF